jgi:hypothetical protein
MTAAIACAVKIATALATAALLATRGFRGRAGGALLAMLGIAGGLGWWYWGTVPIRDDVHVHDVFHYYLAARWFPELGYTRLYQCVLAADLEAGLDPGPRLRDLETNQLVPAISQLDVARACRARFAPERWEAFRQDVEWLRARVSPHEWHQIREDHGFNGSPVWLLGGALLANAPGGARALPRLVLADPLLLAGMWAGVVWAFGWRTAAVAAVFWGTNGVEGWDWTGGTLLRQDWLVTLVLGIAFLRRGRPALAGALLATSTLLRVFPAFAVAGVVLHHGFDALRLRSTTPIRGIARFAAGGLLATALLVPLSAWYGGSDAWPGFVANSRKLADTPLLNQIGLRPVVAFDADTSARRVEQVGAAEPFAVWKQAQRERAAERSWVQVAVLLVWAALFATALHGLGDWGAAALAIGALPLATALTGYYHAALVCLALLFAHQPAVGVIMALLAAATQAIHFALPYSDVPFVAMSVSEIVAVFAITGLLAGDAWRAQSRRASDR